MLSILFMIMIIFNGLVEIEAGMNLADCRENRFEVRQFDKGPVMHVRLHRCARDS